MSEEITVVGGGTGALGQAVVAQLLHLGHRVAVPSRNPDATVAAGATLIPCDLGDPYSVDSFREQVQSLGTWKALVNCSGGYTGGTAHETDDQTIMAQLESNLLGPWRLSRAAALAMKESGTPGHIVNVASRAARNVARGQAAYQVSKNAIVRLTEVMALELHDSAINVNAVLPGTLDTPANRQTMPNANRATWIPLPKLAGVIAWLLSDDAAAITGAAIAI